MGCWGSALADVCMVGYIFFLVLFFAGLAVMVWVMLVGVVHQMGAVVKSL